MPHRLSLLLVLVLVVGCSRTAPPIARPGANVKSMAAVGTQADVARYAPWTPTDPRNPQTRTVQGKTADDWAPQLKAREPAVRQQAADALRQLGEPGYPHLIKGMKSSDPEVAIQAMQAIPPPVLVQQQAETVPALIFILQRDPNAALREQAAMRLAWFDRAPGANKVQAGFQAKQRLDALAYAAQNDASPGVRTAAAGSLACIQQAMSGSVRPD